VGRAVEEVLDNASPMLMIEGVALLGQHAEIGSGVLESGRDQILPAVRAYIDHKTPLPAVRESLPIKEVDPPPPTPPPPPVLGRSRPRLAAMAVTIPIPIAIAIAVVIAILLWLIL